ncbi:Polyketide synthase PksL (plasmid) [Streptomyces griseofuscus]|uniref:Polyketide synthase PksL n=1 Tax=Streptomyces griseofuscus TaxID=146922 RepID=A0A7H1QCZ5_9ACTN|nr:acyl carrier protein [Streptomyces griseofuscus]QNT98175.1 Polyketide synthase PksL [Streptomyces griseofuscus]
MPARRPSARTTAPAAHDTGVLGQVVRMLADVLRLKPEKIDPAQTFRVCGVDSLLAVEYVATVNAHYGTAIKPAALVDHPTPADFAGYVARETGAAPAEMPQVSLRAAAAPLPSAAPSVNLAAEFPGPVPAPPVLDVLREEIARILCCDPWEIGTAEPFSALGVDTALGAEFISVVNLVYGLRERAAVLYDHPNLTALAAHIGAQLPAGPGPVAAPAQAPMPVEALLDAVRDGQVSVEQALALLPRRD